jgi:uncharacterized NAD(P)/FAD-binding protein YdhS
MPLRGPAADPAHRRSVIVLGGGLAGALTVLHLLRQATSPLAITVIEPRARLWAGVAYSSPDGVHITNVPAARMSADLDDPAGFCRWLDAHGDERKGHEYDAYPRRWLFGDYVRALLRAACAARPDISIAHLQQRALDAAREGAGFVIGTDQGSHRGDALVLATGNPTPRWPEALRPIADAPGCVANPWAPRALADVAPDARVLIVGTGLTMGDTVASLRASGHHGAIVAVSRRGQLSRRGMVDVGPPFGDFRSPPRTALGLLLLFRAEVRRAAAAGRPWHAVLAAARADGWVLWQALPVIERRRFTRHLRIFWEIHRHVMPGPVHDMIADECRRNGLRILAGRLQSAMRSGSTVEVLLQPRRGGAGAVRRERFDAVVNCTGPAYAALTTDDPLWASLTRRGLVRADPTGLGPEADGCGRAVDAAGTPQPDLLLAGTLARSAFGELTGVREIALETRLAVATLLAAWAERSIVDARDTERPASARAARN